MTDGSSFLSPLVQADASWTFVLGDATGMTAEERERVVAAGGAPLSLGTQSLLADHCISLVHYNLDPVLGCSPVR
jgi:tRNA pseudouridine-54 N-methylase